MRTYLTPTTVQHVRSFLSRHGMEMRPWSGAEEVLTQLQSLLVRQAGQTRFWADLKALLVEMTTAEGKPRSWRIAGAEVLSQQRVDLVVCEMRRALAGKPSAAPLWLLRRLATGGMCAVLLMGMAACDDGGSGADVTQGQEVEEGDDVEGGDAAEVSIKVEEYIEASDLSSSDKELLLACLEGFSGTDREALLAYFESHSPEEVAAYLEDMTKWTRCVEGPADVVEGKDIKEKDEYEYEDDYWASDLYKGISFPK